MSLKCTVITTFQYNLWKWTYSAREKSKNTADLTKILGVPWDKNSDNLSIAVPEFNEKLITKRTS